MISRTSALKYTETTFWHLNESSHGAAEELFFKVCDSREFLLKWLRPVGLPVKIPFLYQKLKLVKGFLPELHRKLCISDREHVS